MTQTSKNRRRLLSIVLLVTGGFLLAFHERAPTQAMERMSLLLGSAVLLPGIAGILFPAVVPDPKAEFGAYGAVGSYRSPALIFGGFLLFVSLALGMFLAFGR